MTPPPPTLDTTHKTTTQSSTYTWQPNRASYGKIKAGRGNRRATTGGTCDARGKHRGIWTARCSAGAYPGLPPLPTNITQRTAPQTPTPTYFRCPISKSYNGETTRTKPHNYIVADTKNGSCHGPTETPFDARQLTVGRGPWTPLCELWHAKPASHPLASTPDSLPIVGKAQGSDRKCRGNKTGPAYSTQ